MVRMDMDGAVNAAAGAEIRAGRARKDWSRDRLAEEAGLAARTLQRYEEGSRSMPVEVLWRLLVALDMDVSDIDRAISAARKEISDGS